MRNNRKWISWMLFGIYNLFIILLFINIIEFLVGWFNPEIQPIGTSKGLITSNRYFTSAGLTPNSSGLTNGEIITINSLGFRQTNHPFNDQLPTDIYFGDSVTMGLGVTDDSVFSALVQHEIPERNILNVALIGYDIDDYVNLTRHFVLLKDSLSIDRVILFWCLNDVYDSTVTQILPGFRSESTTTNQVISYARSNWKIYSFLKATLTDRPKVYYQYDSTFYSTNTKRYAETIDLLVSINRELSDHGIKFSVILLPYEYQVRNGNQFPQTQILTDLTANKVETFNFVPWFSPNTTISSKLFLYGDGIHFSNRGHRMVSEKIIHSVYSYEK